MTGERLVRIGIVSFLLCAFAQSASSEFTAATAIDFLEAQANVYQSGTEESVEIFVTFLSDDIRDIHVAYGREFSGKDFFRKNMPIKAKSLLHYEREILDIMMGTNVAVVAYRENTKEQKSDGRVSEYSGRTIMVINFNDEGLVTVMRRYMD